MTKENLVPANIEDFFYWINERHQIYINRFEKNQKKPWTKDPIFQLYRFTNVFRQLDKGTIALDEMLGKWFNSDLKLSEMEVEDAIDILFNVVWYRLFNWYEHAKDIGFQKSKDYEFIREVLLKKRKEGKKIFTSAHCQCTCLVKEEHGKLYSHLIAPVGIAEEFGEEFISFIYYNQNLEAVAKKLLELPMIGNFVSYEIVSDLRFTPLLSAATDKLTWANLGPGAKRGLNRLGMDPCVESMVELYKLGIDMVNLDVCKHYPGNNNNYPPFELREIEHSLCEFDKYMRVKTGTGRPRQNYRGV